MQSPCRGSDGCVEGRGCAVVRGPCRRTARGARAPDSAPHPAGRVICLPADPHQLHPARRRLPDNPGSQDPHPHELVLADEDGQPLRLGPAGLTGEGVAGPEAQTGPEGVGVFAWLGKPIDGIFLAALLTVIGYSVNDTVVVFDRVRETWATAARKVPFARVINRAVLRPCPAPTLQCLSRPPSPSSSKHAAAPRRPGRPGPPAQARPAPARWPSHRGAQTPATERRPGGREGGAGGGPGYLRPNESWNRTIFSQDGGWRLLQPRSGDG